MARKQELSARLDQVFSAARSPFRLILLTAGLLGCAGGCIASRQQPQPQQLAPSQNQSTAYGQPAIAPATDVCGPCSIPGPGTDVAATWQFAVDGAPGDAQPFVATNPARRATAIDLPTALRLVDANSPVVALARVRVDEAYLRQKQAALLWLPDLRGGPTYDRDDGRDQQSSGSIFQVSKQSLFVGGGAVLDWDTAEILFGRLAAAQLTEAAEANARIATSDVQLEVAMAYLDLLQAYGEFAIFSDAAADALALLRTAEATARADGGKTAADIYRARTELDLRRGRQYQLQAQIEVISARLNRLLLLPPTVVLKPNEPQVFPVALVPQLENLNALVSIGLSNRPEVQQSRALIAAATTRYRESRFGPFIPHIAVAYDGGTFGGGPNDRFGDFGAHGEGTAGAYWELKNLGASDVVQARVREVQVTEASLNLADVQSRVAEDVTAAARNAEADAGSIQFAEQAVIQALETWNRLRIAPAGAPEAVRQFDPLQPLIALRDLADARRAYLSSVIDFNKSQFRLYWAMGRPPLCALPEMRAQPVKTPVVPVPSAGTEDLPPPARSGR